MLLKQMISCIGYGSGIAAGNSTCGDGPKVFFSRSHFIPDVILTSANKDTPKLDAIAVLCEQLAKRIKRLVSAQQFFAVIGGDHSSAIGTWSGVANSVKNQGNLGLVWIDAHLDSHTFETTESGHIHGMPLAALLGYGDKLLTDIEFMGAKLSPENICVVGARSFEKGEQALLEKLNVRIFYMDEIKQRGLESVLVEAQQIASKNTVTYGLSIDLDAIDPAQAPGTGARVKDGLDAEELIVQLKKYYAHDARLCGVEIAEFNPHLDEENKTEKIIESILEVFNRQNQ